MSGEAELPAYHPPHTEEVQQDSEVLSHAARKVMSKDDPLRIRTEFGEEQTRLANVDKAINMAQAGDQKETEAAYLRQQAKIGEARYDGLPIDEHDAQQDALAKRYLSPASGSFIETYKYARPGMSKDKAEELQGEAERLEYWAGEIHDHPDLAGEMTPQECVNLENWIAMNEKKPLTINLQVEDFKSRDHEEPLSIESVLKEFSNFFGIDDGSSDIHRRFRGLTSNNDTTIGEIKEFIYREMEKVADGWRKSIDVNREKLAAIRGK